MRMQQCRDDGRSDILGEAASDKIFDSRFGFTYKKSENDVCLKNEATIVVKTAILERP